jgi:hypothetical protein
VKRALARLASAFAFVLLLASAARPAELVAERITAQSAAQRAVGGPDAIGGVGDWYLANDVVEVVIDDVSRAYGVSTHGGTVVDFGLRGSADEDQFARLSPIANLSQRVVVGYDAIRAEVDPQGGFARIVVSSPGLRALPRGSRWTRAFDPLVPDPPSVSAVRVETTYEVRPAEPFVRIDTVLTNTGPAPAPVFSFGDVWMRGGRGGRGFTADLASPDRSRGFLARDMSSNIFASLGALTSFSYAALIGAADFPAIAYALDSPERSARGLPLYGLAGEHATLAFGLIGDPPVAQFGLAALTRALAFGELAPGETWRWQRRLRAVGARDLAALDRAVRGELGNGASGDVEGGAAVEGRRAVVSFETPSGATVTATPVDPSTGVFGAALPPGDYQAVLRVEHAAPQRLALHVEPGTAVRPHLIFDPVPAPAHLVFAPAFADGGGGRIEIRGRDGTPDPLFGDDLLGASNDRGPLPNGTASSAVVFIGNDRDPREIEIAPGRYELVATRGLDWEAASQRVELSGPGERAAAAPFVLRPLAPLAGFVTADLHVHGQASDDGEATNEDRLRRFVAEGVDVLVATDHDNVADYAPALARLALAGRVRVVQGVEVTGSGPSAAALWTIGHHNAWPIRYRAEAHRHGAPPSQNRAVGALYAELRSRYGARVVQLNHPRPTPKNIEEGDLNLAFFAHLSTGQAFDPRLPLDAPQNEPLVRRTGADGTRALDFDAMEVMNGDSWPQYLAMRADWYALLRQGVRRTATANSDSHAAAELVAYPRNYVLVGPEGDDPQLFDAALRAGRSFGTNGPRVRALRVNGGGIGEVVAAERGRIRVEYEVDGAGFVPIDEVRVLVNGAVVHAGPERSGALELPLARDGFVTLEAGAPLDVDPGQWIRAHRGLYSEAIAPGFVSAAFTNPVFVDVDGNGRFDPPGL